jgi:GTP-binding protein
MIQNYLIHRENLVCSFVLIDSRLEPQKNDLENLEWFGRKGLPFAIIFTKSDKLGTTILQSNISRYQKKLSELWDPLPDIFISSAEKKLGREEILSFIDHFNKEFQKNKLKK